MSWFICLILFRYVHDTCKALNFFFFSGFPLPAQRLLSCSENYFYFFIIIYLFIFPQYKQKYVFKKLLHGCLFSSLLGAKILAVLQGDVPF